MRSQPAGGLAVNPAIDQRLRHHRQRYLNASKAREQVRQFAFHTALLAHLRNSKLQYRRALPLPAQRHRLLRGMGMAYPRAFLRRSFALLTILRNIWHRR